MVRRFDKLSFAKTVENYPEGIAYIGSTGEIEDSNQTFRELTGFDEGPLERFNSLVHPSDIKKWRRRLAKFLDGRSEITHLVLKLCGRKKNDRWVRLILLPLEDPQDGYLLLLLDITSQKKLEMKLTLARDDAEKAAQSKSSFLANTSHEIRTPIHTITGMSELLANTSLDQEQSDYLGQIRFAAGVLITLVNDLLDFAKIEAGHLRLERTRFNLTGMLEDAIDLNTLEAHRKKVDVGFYIDPQIPSNLYGDPVKLRQVIVNLMSNAIKFTHKGQVVLDVEMTSVSKTGVRLKFTVSDSGVGIPEEKREKLFGAFQQADNSATRQYKGSGLGLFISRSIVSQMGGTLSFVSEVAKGSSFFFEIALENAEVDIPAMNMHRGFSLGKRILVVDDNEAIRDRIARTLESWGFVIHQADSAEAALRMLNSAKSESFEIVLVDQTMPNMDGWQFASKVHSDPSITPPRMILMSMKGEQNSSETKMKLLGWYNSYLTKPMRQKVLSSALLRLLSIDFESEMVEEVEDVAPSREPENRGKGYRILIVEDHTINRKLLQTILKKDGHEVWETVNGKLALSAVLTKKPDLIFMDCQMPVMNGYECSRKIREAGIHTPIIAVTASAIAEERTKCLDCGMNDLIIKPFMQSDIYMMIERYLGVGKELADGPKKGVGINPNEYVDEPVFDYRAAVSIFLGNEDTVRNLMEIQIGKMEEELALIRNAVSSKDWEALGKIAHSMKGSCSNMAMRRCASIARNLEIAANNALETVVLTDLENLEREIPRLKTEIERISQSFRQ